MQKYEDRLLLLEHSQAEQRKEEGRKKARDAYRIKKGIPTDIPLLPRGGARNCKNYTEEELAEKADASKKYQILYQKQYRMSQKLRLLQQTTLQLMEKQAQLIKELENKGCSAEKEIELYKGFEQYFVSLQQ
jgi:hypothetical protein